jgi:site-specific DNA recombinase
MAACCQYAVRTGFSIIAELRDDISGIIAIQERPAGLRLYELVEQGKIDAVIVYTFDRLTRDDKNLEYLIFKDYLNQHQVELHFADTGLDLFGWEGNRMGSIRSFSAAEERRNVLERTRRGKIEHALRGKITLGGHPPYGYRCIGTGQNAEWLIDACEADVVKLIFTWYVDGDGNELPLSIRSIAARLDLIGAPMPNKKRFKDKTGVERNNAQRWIPATIRSILINPIYVGQVQHRKTEVVRTRAGEKRVKRPESERILIEAPELAIIEKSIFEAAYDRIIRNKESPSCNASHGYLMTGHFQCGICGSAMAGTHSRHGEYVQYYYRCGNHWRKPGQGQCPNVNKTIVEGLVDGVVWRWVVNLISDERILDQGLANLTTRRTEENANRKQRLEQVNHLACDTYHRIQSLLRKLSQQDDPIVLEILQSDIKCLTTEWRNLEAERQLLEVEMARINLTAEAQARIKNIAVKIRDRRSNITLEDKSYLFDVLGVNIHP